jgi:hypothetical protein
MRLALHLDGKFESDAFYHGNGRCWGNTNFQELCTASGVYESAGSFNLLVANF